MSSTSDKKSRHYWPFGQLMACRMREFSREPEAWVWTYGFPILVTIALGIAFRNQPATQIVVDIVDNPQAVATQQAFSAEKSPSQPYKSEIAPLSEAEVHLRTGKTDVIVV